MKLIQKLIGIVLVAGAVFVSSSFVAFAQSEDATKQLNDKIQKMKTELSLTAEQEAKVRTILTECQDKVSKVENPTEVQLQELHKDECSKINAVLTPEQQAIFKEMEEKKKKEGQ